jgi:ribonuclease P protein component
MAVSRKVDPQAVGRNRIKRVIRESFRHDHPITPQAGDAMDRRLSRDYVVLPGQRAALTPNGQLTKSLLEHWRVVDRKLEQAADAATGGEPPGCEE